ncbi:hypothetical protein MTO96_046195 [Rhipicephalus appendiculatus]
MADFDNSSVMSSQRSYNGARVVRTNDLIEELISEVRPSRYLYDLMHPDYNNQRKKDNTWESTGKKPLSSSQRSDASQRKRQHIKAQHALPDEAQQSSCGERKRPGSSNPAGQATLQLCVPLK